ncbi:aspartate carbamoyltransferase catalytic subunit [Lactobacillus sp. CC-MHH1034]|nr:aspartate carbamoyltransferase catalytic subunit [Agrilactobacillus fermenti]MCD2256586.1 aspartate carbamoyltransferase catalytic subunit [Agrilactobacillus fermenti]
MRKHDFVTVADLSNDQVLELVQRAEAFKHGASIQLKRPVYAINLFFENSTRTHTSFEMAERKLGMQVLNFEAQTSSIQKGETLYDTVKTVSSIGADIAVIRHPKDAYYQPLLQANLPISIANAGDGAGQHPSQCLLDMMTIYEEFHHFAGLKVAIVGDLLHSRVAKSNMMLLKDLGAEVVFGGPDAWYSDEFAAYGPHLSMGEIVDQVDVLMLLRVQHERLNQTDNQSFSQADYHKKYGLTLERATHLQKQAIIMHPAPVNRGVEIASELVECPQSRIFQQMTNGVFTRMAILETLLRAKNLIQPTSNLSAGADKHVINY